MIRIGSRHRNRIIKNRGRFDESNSVLLLVGRSLESVPLESDHSDGIVSRYDYHANPHRSCRAVMYNLATAADRAFGLLINRLTDAIDANDDEAMRALMNVLAG